MSDALHLDFESGSTCDLRTAGVYRYSEDPETQIWMFSYRFDAEPIQRWMWGDPTPTRALDHIAAGRRVVAHNANFERQMWCTCLRRTYTDWPRLAIEQMCDTMARALAVHLPPDLDTLARVLGLPHLKDKEGHSLMLKMARPKKIHAARPAGLHSAQEWTQRRDGTWIQWNNTPENLAREGTYCDQDVLVECEVDARLPPLSPEERALWELDQRINDRGVALDVATIERACEVRRIALRRADERMRQLTDGAVKKCTETGKILGWLQGRGVACESIAKGEHDEIKVFADCIGDQAARDVITLRADATKTSTAKLEKMLMCICADGRARGLFNYHRALTGRWGGSSVQPQNLPRVDEERELPHVLAAIDAMGMCG